MKCWVLMCGHGYREDGDFEAVRVFLDEAKANEALDAVLAVKAEYPDSCNETHAERMVNLPIRQKAATEKYASIGYPEAKFGAWWELHDCELVGDVSSSMPPE